MPVVFFLSTIALSLRAYNDRRYVAELGKVPLPVGGSAFSARDVQGQPISLDLPSADRFVLLVLHDPNSDREIAYWRKVQSLLPARTALIGFCESAGCAERTGQRREAGFPVAEFGSYGAVLAVTEQDQAGRVPIFGPRGIVLSSVPKQATPEGLASALTGRIDATRR